MKHLPGSGKTACIGLLLAVSAMALPAQTTVAASQQQTPPNPQLKLSPQRQLEEMEPSVNEEYELGPGDELYLNFPGRPELTGKYTIGPDGRITLPMSGQLLINNQTREGAAKSIQEALTPYYTNLTVTVGIEKYGSNHVTVLGNVQHPGVVNFDDTPTLLDAVSRAGLVATPSNKDGIPDRCMIYRGNDKVYTVDLRNLLRSGNAMGDPRLRRNDIVFIPSQADLFVSVLGEVPHPGAVPLTPESTLPSVLAQAGGLGEGAGNSPNILIIQKSNNTTRTIKWKEMMTPSGISEISLQPGDVILVPKTGFYKATYYLQRISPVTSLLTVAALAAP